VREHAAKSNLTVVMIDKKVGGYEHDISYAPVVAALVALVHLPNFKGVFVSIPCGTWSVLRYIRPGPPVLRRLASAINRWIDETLGIRRTDGTVVSRCSWCPASARRPSAPPPTCALGPGSTRGPSSNAGKPIAYCHRSRGIRAALRPVQS